MHANATRPATFASVIPLHPGTPPARRTWPELLWDLGCLEQLWIETELPGVRLTQQARLQGIRVRDHYAWLEGRGFALHGFLAHWQRLRAQPRGLRIEDASGSALLELSLARDASDFALRTLLHTHATVTDERPHASSPGRLHTSPSTWQGPEDPAIRHDLAEACGWLRLHPPRLRDHGRLTLVDHELVGCLFEALADQGRALRVLTGTRGVAQRFSGVFHTHHRRSGPWLQLIGDGARMRLDTAAVDSAWVFQRTGTSRRQLRLYDDSGRALAIIEDHPALDGSEDPIWRTLINALSD
ncbi:hypothetical protein MARPU_13025 [Marichromatium purpuratum 984]|uniref:Haemin-degrading HemS/ChuX domain-containing protein n=1 Tax=Marichromatium purpuratum 984 TaxID=765910 RepID=W0E408_MARPU|nr:hypothetical protein [Marichromatium purpuratum]AHF05595.1 hypothetical protein MARPU_13025 [Marichromatium purpuratum 984]